MLIVNQFLLNGNRGSGSIYVQYRKWNAMPRLQTLLAFANSCQYLKSIVEPFIFKNFGLFIESTKEIYNSQQSVSDHSQRFRENLSLINFEGKMNFFINWKSEIYPPHILGYVKHLFMCRVRNADYLINLWPLTGLINTETMPQLREITISLKSGCDGNDEDDFGTLAENIRQFSDYIAVHAHFPLTYWDHDSTVLDRMDIYEHIESFSVSTSRAEYFTYPLLARLSAMVSLERLLIEMNLNLTDDAEVKLKTNSPDYFDEDDDQDADDKKKPDSFDFIEHVDEHSAASWTTRQTLSVVKHNGKNYYINDYINTLDYLEHVEILGFKLFDPDLSWIVTPSLTSLKISYLEFQDLSIEMPSLDSVEELHIIPSAHSEEIMLKFFNLKSLTIGAHELEYFEDISACNPLLTNLTITDINHEEYDQLPDLPEQLEKLELQYFYTENVMEGRKCYDILETLLVGPNLKVVCFHIPHHSISLKELQDIVVGCACPKLEKLYITISPSINLATPREKHIPRRHPRFMRGKLQVLDRLYELFRERPRELAKLLPKGVSLVDFCFLVDILPPRYRRLDYLHLYQLPYTGVDYWVSNFVIDVRSLRKVLNV